MIESLRIEEERIKASKKFRLPQAVIDRAESLHADERTRLNQAQADRQTAHLALMRSSGHLR